MEKGVGTVIICNPRTPTLGEAFQREAGARPFTTYICRDNPVLASRAAGSELDVLTKSFCNNVTGTKFGIIPSPSSLVRQIATRNNSKGFII